MWRNVLAVVVLTLMYGLVIVGLIGLFRLVRINRRWAILLGFLVYGFFSGWVAARLWPYDSCVLPNVYATSLGDLVYGRWAERFGYPWLLGVPQVYVVASAILAGLAGTLAQWLDARARARKNASPGR